MELIRSPAGVYYKDLLDVCSTCYRAK